MFRRSTFALNTEVEDSDSQETQCDELRQLVVAQLQAELKGGTVCTLTTECSEAEVSWTAWSLSRVPGRPDSERDDHRMSAHEVNVSVAQQQQEVVRATHSEVI